MKKVLKNISRVLFSLLLIFSIFGTFNVLAEEVIFKITKIEVKEKSDKVTVNDVSLSGGSINNDIVFTDKDDYIKYEITFKNTTDNKYKILSISDDNDSEYLDYTYDNLSNTELNGGDEKTFNLTITYKQETNNLTISDKAVSLTLTYEKDDGTTGTETITNDDNNATNDNNTTKTGEVKGEQTITNPKTGDNVTTYIILGIVSLVGLAITTVSKKHLSKSLMTIALVSSIALPLGVKADSDKFNIVFNNTIKVREYTVTFNTNGGTEISSIKAVKGNKITKPADPTKTDYIFDNWYTDNTYTTLFDFDNMIITEDTAIYAKWNDLCNGFSTDSWATIVSNLASNSNHYSSTIGCKKEVEMDMDDDGVNESYTVRLANTSTPTVCNTTGYSQTSCGTVIEFYDIVDARKMNNQGTNVGGWKATVLAAWLNGEFYNKLPDDLKTVIIPTYPIVSGSGARLESPDITASDTTLNKIYLLSTREVGINEQYDNKKNIDTDTRTLDIYSNTSTLVSVQQKMKIDGTKQRWWLRTADSHSNGNFYGVGLNGGFIIHVAFATNGVAPAFRIGNPN